MRDHGRERAASPKAGRRITITDLSAELGLSITTISRALNGYSDVGEKTRERVEDAAQRLGYRPNKHAQRLVTRRTHNIAWIQSDNDRKFVDPHFAEVMAGVLRNARSHNYDLLLTSDTPEHQLAVYDRYIRDNSADGFIVDLPEPNDPRIAFLLECRQPFVVHGRDFGSEGYAWVDIDNYGNFRDVTRLLIANGHARIALINGDEHYSFALERRRAVEDAVREAGLPPDALTVYNAVHPMGDAGFKLTETALARADVTALVYSSALMAVEGYSAIMRSGRSVGDDLAVASMDDSLHYLDLAPYREQITFVKSSLREAGGQLVTSLIRACEGKERQRGVVIPSEIQPARGMDPSVLNRRD